MTYSNKETILDSPAIYTIKNFFDSFRFQSNFKKESLFVAIFGLSIFYILSLFSFDPFDPSFVSVSTADVLPKNFGGQLGANVSGMVFYLIGLGAYLLPLPFLCISVLMFFQGAQPFSRSRLAGWGVIIFCCSVFSTKYLTDFQLHSIALPSGGVLGVGALRLLSRILGKTGADLILWTIFFAALLLVLQKSFIGMLLGIFSGNIFKIGILHKIIQFVDKHRPKTISKREDFSDLIVDDPPTLELFNKEPSGDTQKIFSLRQEDNFEQLLEDKIKIKEKKSAQKSYSPPSLSLLRKNTESPYFSLERKKELEATSNLLLKTLEDFEITGNIVGHLSGPVVTVFEFQPSAGIKQSKIIGLADDLALALKVDSIFIHPVRGKHALGIQVPNRIREPVFLGDIVDNDSFIKASSPLLFAMGKSLSGQPVYADLGSMPHLLTAGATGSGKSVAINTLLSSIILRVPPEDVKMILVDPKMLELSVYDGIPHLLMPVITEPQRATLALKWVIREMERRYRLMQLASVRHISSFNQFLENSGSEDKIKFFHLAGEEITAKLPYLLIVIDELADLMLTAPKDIESYIQRLAQKARASGIHLVLATQRPSVDIITGVIKANLPCRLSFQVVSKHDSRTIIDQIGAEKLLGKGDMLLQLPGVTRMERIQGAFISDEEVLSLVAAAKTNRNAEHDETIISWINNEIDRAQYQDTGILGDEIEDDSDPLYRDAMNIARSNGAISASFLQRQLKIGYNRAARIVEHMEAKGIVAKADGVRPRKWLGEHITQ